jgi:hypothetical protein
MRPSIIGQHFALTFRETGFVTLHYVDHNGGDHPGEPLATFPRDQLACLESVAFEGNLRCQMETAFKEAMREGGFLSLKERKVEEISYENLE